ncbi:hypothetical protein [Nostoc sp.]|uniref:hypothetical protein n=1 Tax=Nostoc sp. TaxID=1180 RepID=UPI002FF7353E
MFSISDIFIPGDYLSIDRKISGAVSDELSIIQPYQLVVCILDRRFCVGNVTNPNRDRHAI